MLPNGKENTGKKEKHLAQTEFVTVSGMEHLGGKVEDGETRIKALKNEVWQEGRIPLFKSQIIDAEFGAIVQQEDRGTFDVSIYYLNLYWWQELMLIVIKKAKVINPSMMDAGNTRMRDLKITQLAENIL